MLDLQPVRLQGPRWVRPPDSAAPACPALPPGQRVYAVGDVHGRFDLFDALIERIRVDAGQRPPARTTLVVLGDFIDRGPASAELTLRLMRYARSTPRFVVLKGNHEQMMVRALRGDHNTLRAWFTFGGDATLASWGAPPEVIEAGFVTRLMDSARSCVGDDVIEWLDQLPHAHQSGGYLFVHAGIKPGVPLPQQDPDDLLWVGASFREHADAHPLFIVHGHSINENGPEVRSNRIGLDTGAYRTGRLSAIGLERDQAWLLTAVGAPQQAAPLGSASDGGHGP